MTDQSPQTQTQTDKLDPARARALQASLGDTPTITQGSALPPFAHQIYFWDPQIPDQLGPDGHPATGDFIPDMGAARRMWAAGRLVFHHPLYAGIQAEKTSCVETVTKKNGKSGALTFVRLRHDIRQRQALAVTEWQDIVYRAPSGGVPPAPPRAPTDETLRQTMQCDTTLLFRYSALTFNGHRIHYDETYAREVEGYEGLVVHGPLLAHILMGIAAAQLGSLTEFSYRATAPLLHHETAEFCWKDGQAWVRGPDGRQCMAAQAR